MEPDNKDKAVAPLRRQKFHRAVYNGAPITQGYKIVSVKSVPLGKNEKARTVPVDNLHQYESGCMAHADCFGHLCVSPSGAVLPPQSMSMRSGDIATEYNKAARLTFKGDIKSYRSAVMSTNYTKHGTMRSIMSSPIAGSCRLIASPQWELGRHCIAISKNLASKMNICYQESLSDGSRSSHYKERTLRENDWVIAVRPPSFHLGNTQPMKVKFWDHDCIGIHPESFSAFHGDFDGDEIHMYPVLNEDSQRECESWDQLPLRTFTMGRDLFNSVLPQLKQGNENTIDTCSSDSATFLSFTTLSAAQIKQSPQNLVFGEFSRNKFHHINGFHSRFNDSNTEKNFVTESIRGMGDVARQQLSQGELGYMTRTAKVVISCFFRPVAGGLHVARRGDTQLLVDDGIKDSGTPSVRGMQYICAVAQQAALDAHRAESHNTFSHDFVSDLVIGPEKLGDKTPTSMYTLVEFGTNIENDALESIKPKWKYYAGTGTFCLCKPRDVPRQLARHIVSCYNPLLLSLAQDSGLNVQRIAHRGITIICNHYGISISPIELHDVSQAYAYLPSLSLHPITTREGIMDRKMGWIETMLATDYTRLPYLNDTAETPNTSTACTFMGNFDNVLLKTDET